MIREPGYLTTSKIITFGAEVWGKLVLGMLVSQPGGLGFYFFYRSVIILANNKFILVLGGARSGKSSFAESLAGLSGDPVAYIATAAAWDEEMRQRIALHRQQRPAHWATFEEELWVKDQLGALQGRFPVVMIDCLTLLVTNLLLNPAFAGSAELTSQEQEKMILHELEQLGQLCRSFDGTVIMVSNEVGLGLVPENVLGRQYRDLAGRANQLMASFAHEVFLIVAGIPVELKELSTRVSEKLGMVKSDD